MPHRYNGVHDHNHRRKTIYLPIMCSKPSIKDVRLPESDRSRSNSFSGDPLSPKIGCMGQVKRNNRVAELPISHRLTFSKNAAVFNCHGGDNVNYGYRKLKKFFSSKNLLTAGNGEIAAKKDVVENENCDSFNIVDLDPPLPVIKRTHKDGEGAEMENLWKRRFGGTVLQSLQIEQTHLPNHRLQIKTV